MKYIIYFLLLFSGSTTLFAVNGSCVDVIFHNKTKREITIKLVRTDPEQKQFNFDFPNKAFFLTPGESTETFKVSTFSGTLTECFYEIEISWVSKPTKKKRVYLFEIDDILKRSRSCPSNIIHVYIKAGIIYGFNIETSCQPKHIEISDEAEDEAD